MNSSPPTIPCKECGTPTSMQGTHLCDNCWELHSRLSTLRGVCINGFLLTTEEQESLAVCLRLVAEMRRDPNLTASAWWLLSLLEETP